MTEHITLANTPPKNEKSKNANDLKIVNQMIRFIYAYNKIYLSAVIISGVLYIANLYS